MVINPAVSDKQSFLAYKKATCFSCINHCAHHNEDRAQLLYLFVCAFPIHVTYNIYGYRVGTCIIVFTMSWGIYA